MLRHRTAMLVTGIAISAFLLRLALRSMQAAEFRDAMMRVDHRQLLRLTPNAPGYPGGMQAVTYWRRRRRVAMLPGGLAASIILHVIYTVTAIGIGAYALRRASIELRVVGGRGAGGGDVVVVLTGKDG